MTSPRRVAILGGGMAGLAAAWRLSRPDGPGHQVTVFQRGGRLGGKGASSRGRHGRIEEHGLHVWPGYYDNAFALMRACYGELDRDRTDPDCPIKTWKDAFFPASTVAVGHDGRNGWERWLAVFPENNLVPGDRSGAAGPSELLARAVAMLGTLTQSLGDGPSSPRATLSTHATPPSRPRTSLVGGAKAQRRVAEFAQLLTVMVRGIIADRLTTLGYEAIDDLDFREWLAQHGATATALDGPLVNGMYDLVFGYRHGDRSRPEFSAGVGLHLSSRMFLTYRGALFWKMRAGMGDVVFAPLFEALRRRGVRFEFFHRLDSVRLSEDGTAVEALSFGRQVDLAPGRVAYQPLTRVRGLPVFSDAVDTSQLLGVTAVAERDLESHWCERRDAGRVRLERGVEFDDAVLAVSLGMVPHVAPEVLARDGRWRAMVEHVTTVATQSCQLWLDESEASFGWKGSAAVMTGCGTPFDTFASMSHTLPYEDWPEPRPATSASFCAVLPEADASEPAEAAHRTVRRNAVEFLEHRARRFWPKSSTDAGFRWDALAVREPRGRRGTDRIDSQYWRANTDPSDRYVQSPPGSGRFRLAADQSGVDHLFLAGDWIDTGLNAGCIEAAVLSGLQAANAVEHEPLTLGTTGYAPHSVSKP